jgi:hypothetical protein
VAKDGNTVRATVIGQREGAQSRMITIEETSRGEKLAIVLKMPKMLVEKASSRLEFSKKSHPRCFIRNGRDFGTFSLEPYANFCRKISGKIQFCDKIRLESKIPFFYNSLFEELQMAKQKLLRTTS